MTAALNSPAQRSTVEDWLFWAAPIGVNVLTLMSAEQGVAEKEQTASANFHWVYKNSMSYSSKGVISFFGSSIHDVLIWSQNF